MKHHYLIFALLCCVSTSFAQTLEDDRLALVALFNATNGNNWTNKTGWNPSGAPGDNPCGWYGVSCENNRVTGLNLENNDLFGTLPAKLGDLSALKSLNLRRNTWGGIGVFGAIPIQLGNLINLEYLNIGENRFSGSIPLSIGNLVKLTYLNINYTPIGEGFDRVGVLGGSIPIELGNLINLKHLDLARQNLSGVIPAVLGNLTHLEYLNLSDNTLNGSIPSTFGNLANLTFLDLSYVITFERGHELMGALGGAIPDLSGLPSLANIYVYGNSFTFDGMETNISRLESYYNQAKIPMHGYFPLSSSSGPSGMLYVEAGGTLANNTYKWYKNGVLVATNIGIPYFNANELGTFRVEVTNSIATQLKLVSDDYTVSSLPVTLTTFSGKTSSEGNILTWKTTSETNNKGFQIERSADARTFESIGFVDGLGDNLGDKTYTFLDTKPYFNTYYRLKQLDWDGKSEYSRIITVKQEKTKLSVYPNPAKNEFFVSGLDREEAVEIRNAEGRVVLEQKLNPGQPVPASQLANGIYFIKIGEKTRKLVIQN